LKVRLEERSGACVRASAASALEALGLELLEVRRIHATPTSPAHTEPGPFDRRD
jgi:hypothetical protein